MDRLDKVLPVSGFEGCQRINVLSVTVLTGTEEQILYIYIYIYYIYNTVISIILNIYNKVLVFNILISLMLTI